MANNIIKYIGPTDKLDATYISRGGLKRYYRVGNRKDVPTWLVMDEQGLTYYSGLQVSVYFGNIFLDEAVALSYAENESVLPVYGYADYTFRRVIHGTRVVQGSFTINFKTNGYVLEMLKRVTSPKSGTSTKDSSGSGLPNDLTLEDLINLRRKSQDHATRVMEELRSKYWGTGKGSTDAVTESVDMEPKYSASGVAPSEGVDIVVKYGQPGSGDSGWGTLEIIRGCHITGVSKSITDDGRGVLEEYQFIARTVE